MKSDPVLGVQGQKNEERSKSSGMAWVVLGQILVGLVCEYAFGYAHTPWRVHVVTMHMYGLGEAMSRYSFCAMKGFNVQLTYSFM